ncbi:MAG: hypothetical protein KDH96_08715, partial [Candidatus Riesia sp.]|nr:hypothetical protein [Candidatus Riesia sp.]
MQYEFYHDIYGGLSNNTNEYEYQTILPDIYGFINVLNNIKVNKKNFISGGIVVGKEHSFKSANTKYVTRIARIKGSERKIFNYKKIKLSVIKPFTSLDITTTFRHSSEIPQNSPIKSSINKKINTKLYIRYVFILDVDSSVVIHLTLSWNARGYSLTNEEESLFKNIIDMVSDSKKYFLLTITQKMFNAVIEMEVPSQDYYEKFKEEFRSLLSPVMPQLIFANINTKTMNICNYSENNRYRMHSLIQWSNFLKKPKNLNMIDFKREVLLNLFNYCVSPKADGVHISILYQDIDNPSMVIIFTEKFSYIYIKKKRYDIDEFDEIFEKYDVKDFSTFKFIEGEIFDNDSILVYDYSDVNDTDINRF